MKDTRKQRRLQGDMERETEIARAEVADLTVQLRKVLCSTKMCVWYIAVLAIVRTQVSRSSLGSAALPVPSFPPRPWRKTSRGKCLISLREPRHPLPAENRLTCSVDWLLYVEMR